MYIQVLIRITSIDDLLFASDLETALARESTAFRMLGDNNFIVFEACLPLIPSSSLRKFLTDRRVEFHLNNHDEVKDQELHPNHRSCSSVYEDSSTVGGCLPMNK